MNRKRLPRPAFAGAGHDHESCVRGALAAAARLCRARGARLTEARRRVLELVWQSHAPVGAYRLLDGLGRGPSGRGTAPPTVYRALDFLVAQGLVHRIESQNAYVGCAAPGRPHAGLFLICGDCGAAAELDDSRIDAAVAAGCGAAGFLAHRLTLEVLGTCPDCQGA